MSMVSMVVGAVTSTSAVFVTKVTNGPVRIAVSLNSGMGAPVFSSSTAVDAQGVAKVSVSGLTASTRYWWQVEDNGILDTSVTGQFLTHPTPGLPASFTLGVAGDSGLAPEVPGTGVVLAADRLSNHSIFNIIQTRALAENWIEFFHLGDLHYYDLGSGSHGIVGGGSTANYRRAYDDVLSQTNQHSLYRSVAWGHLWDDHDYGPDNSDGTLATKGNAATAYRERVPHRTLPAGAGANPIYHSWNVGRVLFIAADVRYDRSPNTDPDGPSKTMLGAAQKTWMQGLLSTSDAKFLVWVMPDQWMGTGVDTWASFQTEQAEMVAMFGDHDWLNRMCIVAADVHMIAMDTGGNSPGGIPVLQASSLDSTPTGDPSIYNMGGSPAREQYGTLTISDFGTHLTIRLTGWRGTNTQVVSFQFAVMGDPPPPLSSGALLRSIAGSHQVMFEARVLDTYQDGPQPVGGVELAIIDGDVRMDATADIQRTLQLRVDGSKLWPRRATDLLAPMGNEIFVRRGVSTGASVIWVPLGYFRIDDVEQSEAHDGEIILDCQDRMSSIVEGKFLEPRIYQADQTVAQVFDELVHEIYPDAVVLFDDTTGSSALGRNVSSEESRYQFLRDIADARGKDMFWDGDGVLRISSPPDFTVPVWEVRAGHKGVSIKVGRRTTRQGVYNGVVATGEGASSLQPVRAVAVDANPLSPTLWGGRFGRVPRFYASPLIATNEQAQEAAATILRRSIGRPYSVDFESVVNPAIIPGDPIRVIYKDGNRELHIIETVTIPLSADEHMTATTREQTLVEIRGTIDA